MRELMNSGRTSIEKENIKKKQSELKNTINEKKIHQRGSRAHQRMQKNGSAIWKT